LDDKKGGLGKEFTRNGGKEGRRVGASPSPSETKIEREGGASPSPSEGGDVQIECG